jgi:hypothetical protein
MGKMKEEFMRMQVEAFNAGNAMHNIAENPYGKTKENINQLNNKQMSKKTMQEKLRKQPEPVAETRIEALRRLYIENGLVEEDVHKDPRGFSTLKRTGIDKIASRNGITVGYEIITLDLKEGECVVKAAATMKVGNDVKNMMDFGEASIERNLTGGGKKWVVSMAKKRAMARVVMALTGFSAQGMYSEDDMAFDMDE